MSKKKRTGRIFAAILSALMIIGGASPVFAETVGDYNADEHGSITLYKYVSNDGASLTTDGKALAPTPDTQLDAVEAASGNYNMIPEEGVHFKYLKVADFEQVSSGTTTGAFFTGFDAEFFGLFSSYNVPITSASLTATPDRSKSAQNKHYTTDSVYEAMLALNAAPANASQSTPAETAIRNLVKNRGTDFSVTDYYGRAKAEDLPVGLYLVAEVDWEHQVIAKHDTYWVRLDTTVDTGDGAETADIVSPSSPFLVQIPYTVSDGWLYDVTAYPKNGTINIHKDFLVENYTNSNEKLDTELTETMCDFRQLNYAKSEGGQYTSGYSDQTKIDGQFDAYATHQRDANIGDTVVQLISSDVPALVGDKKNTTYKITDHMTKGLKFVKVENVRLSQNPFTSGGGTTLTANTDYTVTSASDGSSFTVTLTSAGLAKLDAVPSASYLYIRFSSVVTKDALIGTDTYPFKTNDGATVAATNQNTAMLTYATDRTLEHDYYSNTCKIYTYEIDITKSMVEKIVGAEDKSAIDKGIDYTAVKFTVKGSTKGFTDMGDVLFYKESSGVYHVWDKTTDGGSYSASADKITSPTAVTKYVSPDANGSLKLKGVDSRDYQFTEVATSDGYQLLSSPFTVRLIANKLADESNAKYENGALSHVYVWSGDTPDNLSEYDLLLSGELAAEMQRGRAPILIQNNSVYHVLRTGGHGISRFLFAGFALFACATYLFVHTKNKQGRA